jgi:hypothetical protein
MVLDPHELRPDGFMRDARQRALDNLLLAMALNELIDLVARARVDSIEDGVAQRVAVRVGRQRARPDAADGDATDGPKTLVLQP